MRQSDFADSVEVAADSKQRADGALVEGDQQSDFQKQIRSQKTSVSRNTYTVNVDLATLDDDKTDEGA